MDGMSFSRPEEIENRSRSFESEKDVDENGTRYTSAAQEYFKYELMLNIGFLQKVIEFFSVIVKIVHFIHRININQLFVTRIVWWHSTIFR